MRRDRLCGRKARSSVARMGQPIRLRCRFRDAGDEPDFPTIKCAHLDLSDVKPDHALDEGYAIDRAGPRSPAASSSRPARPAALPRGDRRRAGAVRVPPRGPERVAGDVQLGIEVVGLAAGAGRRVRQRHGWLRHARRRLAVESDPRVGPTRLDAIETGELPDGAASHQKLLARLLLHAIATIA